MTRLLPLLVDGLLLLGAAILENFGDRQLNSLWRIAGTWQYVTGAKASWGEMSRRGFKRS